MAVQNDWQFRPVARKCAVSGAEFEIGQHVICFLFQDENGELERADVLPDHADAFSPPGLLLGRWSREIRDNTDEEKEARRAMLVSTEELFLSLLDGEEAAPLPVDEDADSAEAAELRGRLLQVLALQLERKRILRPMGKPVDGRQPYLHVKSKRELAVPASDLEPENLLRVQEQLSALVI